MGIFIQQLTMSIQFLVSYNTTTDLHSFNVETIEELQNELKGAYNLDNLTICYFDDEGDCVKLTSKPEFDEAIAFAQDNGDFLSIILEAPIVPEPEQPKVNLKNIISPFLNLLGQNSPIEGIVNEIVENSQKFIDDLNPSDIEHAVRNVHEWIEDEIPELAQHLIQPQEAPKAVVVEPVISQAIVEEPKPVHHAICDNCNQTIVGIRYKCLQCADFDFCEVCEAPETGHDQTHVFAKLYRPDQSIPVQKKKRGCPARKNRMNKLEKDVEALQQQVADLLAKKQAPVEVEPEVCEVAPEVPQEPVAEEVEVVEEVVEAVEAPISPEIQKKLESLEAMGFEDNERNLAYLIAHNGDLDAVLE